MKILVIGGGGREHALVWKISQSPLVKKIFCAPGNAGIAELGECVNVKATDTEKLVAFAEKEKIDLTVVGPEAPLVEGVVDKLSERGLRAFGPRAEAALLEGSKIFAKKLMAKYNIPTGTFHTFCEAEEAAEFVHEIGTPVVIKADGLAAGKGVIVAFDEKVALSAVNQCLVEGAFGRAGSRIVIEEFLQGEEASVLAFTDGRNILTMPASQDHKAIYDGDKGPNTGGMGAYSPAPVVSPTLLEHIENQIIRPTIDALRHEGCEYRGVIYCGIMMTEAGPKVLEYNVRFGDPEAQVVIPRLKSDLVPLMLACADGTLSDMQAEWTDDAAVCVVLASGGYPGKYKKGMRITGLENARKVAGAIVFHAGTELKDGQVVTDGGRVIGATALGEDIPSAIERAYQCAETIRFEGRYFRSDIGKKALARLERDS
ncbi:MAG: phosphoribosylamine--glycine ligase [Candidatus Abyssobacteria bacterium SURF_5]|uniref:Phosphoribosylamine--glycine ligase n=1 Tax=Abyssobacteria bacterium (strain SURF_5) TaxID=2093360 RepID=A0A3A4P1H5_ABYX5|nr:MAG: phosphoribosylamine--glycine ligase [Candidatus Abyssubacteria bacterium SURF_5]